MNEHEIKEYDKIPKHERPQWSKPFKVGDVIPILGKQMRIKKVKPLRGELVLQVLNPNGD